MSFVLGTRSISGAPFDREAARIEARNVEMQLQRNNVNNSLYVREVYLPKSLDQEGKVLLPRLEIEALSELFKKFGKISKIDIQSDYGFAFIEYENRRGLDTALAQPEGSLVCNGATLVAYERASSNRKRYNGNSKKAHKSNQYGEGQPHSPHHHHHYQYGYQQQHQKHFRVAPNNEQSQYQEQQYQRQHYPQQKYQQQQQQHYPQQQYQQQRYPQQQQHYPQQQYQQQRYSQQQHQQQQQHFTPRSQMRAQKRQTKKQEHKLLHQLSNDYSIESIEIMRSAMKVQNEPQTQTQTQVHERQRETNEAFNVALFKSNSEYEYNDCSDCVPLESPLPPQPSLSLPPPPPSPNVMKMTTDEDYFHDAMIGTGDIYEYDCTSVDSGDNTSSSCQSADNNSTGYNSNSCNTSSNSTGEKESMDDSDAFDTYSAHYTEDEFYDSVLRYAM